MSTTYVNLSVSGSGAGLELRDMRGGTAHSVVVALRYGLISVSMWWDRLVWPSWHSPQLFEHRSNACWLLLKSWSAPFGSLSTPFKACYAVETAQVSFLSRSSVSLDFLYLCQLIQSAAVALRSVCVRIGRIWGSRMLEIILRILNRVERNLYDLIQTVPGFHFSSHLPCRRLRDFSLIMWPTSTLLFWTPWPWRTLRLYRNLILASRIVSAGS